MGALGFCLGGKLAYLAAARSGVDVARLATTALASSSTLNELPK